jgi:branched-chain amino acid transport system ATP-binding protein
MTSSLVVERLEIERGGRPVLRGVDLTVDAGRVTALLGPNGAGKSTLVLGLTGLLPATGAVRLGDDALLGKRPDRIRRAGLAAVPEGHRVLTRLSVRENIVAALGSNPATSPQEAMDLAFETFPELDPIADQAAGSLSGGQQQMLAFGQALVARPKVLVVDEMSLGLAPVVVKRLAGVIASVAETGTGVLLIEQYTTVALELAEVAYVMHKGAITFHGPAQHLADDPDALHGAYFGETTDTGDENHA